MVNHKGTQTRGTEHGGLMNYPKQSKQSWPVSFLFIRRDGSLLSFHRTVPELTRRSRRVFARTVAPLLTADISNNCTGG